MCHRPHDIGTRRAESHLHGEFPIGGSGGGAHPGVQGEFARPVVVIDLDLLSVESDLISRASGLIDRGNSTTLLDGDQELVPAANPTRASSDRPQPQIN